MKSLTILTGWCSTPTQLLICSSFNRENGHPLFICSSLSTAQLISESLLPIIIFQGKIWRLPIIGSIDFWRHGHRHLLHLLHLLHRHAYLGNHPGTHGDLGGHPWHFRVKLGVSKNRGKTPQIIHFNRVFHCKPSILGYPYIWKHPFLVNIKIINKTYTYTTCTCYLYILYPALILSFPKQEIYKTLPSCYM